MQIDNSYKSVEGAYAVPRISDNIVVIKVPQEDSGKKEGDASWSELSPVLATMFGIISGKAEEGEAYTETLSRELLEEQGIHKEPAVFSNGLPTAHIIQERPGKKYAFTVHGHQFSLTAADLSELKARTETIEIAETRLGEFLRDNSTILRPSVHAILNLVYQQLEQKDSEYFRQNV